MRALLCAVLCGTAAAVNLLRDAPVIALGDVQYLDGTWALTDNATGMSLEGTVPGDLLSDLQAAKKLRDPYYENNFLDPDQQALWYHKAWTYTKTLQAPRSGTALLVFEGIKMSATVRFDGEVIGAALDQFLRYTYQVQVTAGSTHTVTVTFDWQDIHGRWMACSGGWDWAPYTSTYHNETDSFAYGIWKSVYVVLPAAQQGQNPSSAAAATPPAHVAHFTPQVHYNLDGDYRNYPASPLAPHTHRSFTVVSKVVVSHSAPLQLQVAVTGSWGSHAKNTTTFNIAAPVRYSAASPSPPPSSAAPTGETTVDIRLDAAASDIDLWWPNGMGAQPLYTVTAEFTDAATGAVWGTATRRIGFKFLAVVTGNDADPDYVQDNFGKDGTDTLGMAFRVNGALMFARGGNVIPMEELDSRMDATAYRLMVRSAADAGMNTFRLWGGGIFPPTAFYEACDEAGLLLYHDMMYAQAGHSPLATDTQDAELRHQVRRVSHHPSVGLWDGCNECTVVLNTSTGIYATFVLRVVVEEDASHPVWPSCPSQGWAGGVERLTSLPDPARAASLAPQTQLSREIETHGPYQHQDHGTPFDTINMALFRNTTNPYPVAVSTAATGLGQPSVFASEFGGSVLTSFESLAPTLDESHWAMYGGLPAGACSGGGQQLRCEGDNPMQQRNYGCDSMMQKYFGWAGASQAVMNTTGAGYFKRALYLCMLAQALDMKSDVESRRSQNQYGVILWQLNEIWPTGGWGSLEYGAPNQNGIVIGGRWKPLHYFYKKMLFRDVIVICGTSDSSNGLICVVKNNKNTPLAGGVVGLQFLDVTGAERHSETSVNIAAVPAGGGAQAFPLDLPAGVSVSTHILRANVTAGGAVEAENEIPLAYPFQMRIDTSATVDLNVVGSVNSSDPLSPIALALSASGTALYVHLTTTAHGRFSDNSFALSSVDGPKTVLFIPWVANQESALRYSLRWEHLNMYL